VCVLKFGLKKVYVEILVFGVCLRRWRKMELLLLMLLLLVTRRQGR